MRSQATAVEDRTKPLKVKLTDARMLLVKLAVESSRTKADLPAETIAVKKSFKMEKACVESLYRGLVTGVEK